MPGIIPLALLTTSCHLLLLLSSPHFSIPLLVHSTEPKPPPRGLGLSIFGLPPPAKIPDHLLDQQEEVRRREDRELQEANQEYQKMMKQRERERKQRERVLRSSSKDAKSNSQISESSDSQSRHADDDMDPHLLHDQQKYLSKCPVNRLLAVDTVEDLQDKDPIDYVLKETDLLRYVKRKVGKRIRRRKRQLREQEIMKRKKRKLMREKQSKLRGEQGYQQGMISEQEVAVPSQFDINVNEDAIDDTTINQQDLDNIKIDTSDPTLSESYLFDTLAINQNLHDFQLNDLHRRLSQSPTCENLHSGPHTWENIRISYDHINDISQNGGLDNDPAAPQKRKQYMPLLEELILKPSFGYWSKALKVPRWGYKNSTNPGVDLDVVYYYSGLSRFVPSAISGEYQPVQNFGRPSVSLKKGLGQSGIHYENVDLYILVAVDDSSMCTTDGIYKNSAGVSVYNEWDIQEFDRGKKVVDWKVCQNSTAVLASAYSIMVDQCHRPFAGVNQYCSNSPNSEMALVDPRDGVSPMVDNEGNELAVGDDIADVGNGIFQEKLNQRNIRRNIYFQLSTAIHEIAHVLYFYQQMYKAFRNTGSSLIQNGGTKAPGSPMIGGWDDDDLTLIRWDTSGYWNKPLSSYGSSYIVELYDPINNMIAASDNKFGSSIGTHQNCVCPHGTIEQVQAYQGNSDDPNIDNSLSSNTLFQTCITRSDGIPEHDKLVPSCQYEVRFEEVVKKAKTFFDCPDLTGVPLENQPTTRGAIISSHWEQRLFHNELMAPSGQAFDATFVSEVTLALAESSGWYQVDYSTASVPIEGLHYGYRQGCKFLRNSCIESSSDPPGNPGASTLSTPNPDFWCHSAQSIRCVQTETGQQAGTCMIADYNLVYGSGGVVPEKMQYFTDGRYGGYVARQDFCPSYIAFTDGDCSNPNNHVPQYLWYTGSSSMCINSRLASNPDGSIVMIDSTISKEVFTSCMRIECYEDNSQTTGDDNLFGLFVNISNYEYHIGNCSKTWSPQNDRKLKEVNGDFLSTDGNGEGSEEFNDVVECPDYNLVCGKHHQPGMSPHYLVGWNGGEVESKFGYSELHGKRYEEDSMDFNGIEKGRSFMEAVSYDVWGKEAVYTWGNRSQFCQYGFSNWNPEEQQDSVQDLERLMPPLPVVVNSNSGKVVQVQGNQNMYKNLGTIHGYYDTNGNPNLYSNGGNIDSYGQYKSQSNNGQYPVSASCPDSCSVYRDSYCGPNYGRCITYFCHECLNVFCGSYDGKETLYYFDSDYTKNPDIPLSLNDPKYALKFYQCRTQTVACNNVCSKCNVPSTASVDYSLDIVTTTSGTPPLTTTAVSPIKVTNRCAIKYKTSTSGDFQNTPVLCPIDCPLFSHRFCTIDNGPGMCVSQVCKICDDKCLGDYVNSGMTQQAADQLYECWNSCSESCQSMMCADAQYGGSNKIIDVSIDGTPIENYLSYNEMLGQYDDSTGQNSALQLESEDHYGGMWDKNQVLTSPGNDTKKGFVMNNGIATGKSISDIADRSSAPGNDNSEKVISMILNPQYNYTLAALRNTITPSITTDHFWAYDANLSMSESSSSIAVDYNYDTNPIDLQPNNPNHKYIQQIDYDPKNINSSCTVAYSKNLAPVCGVFFDSQGSGGCTSWYSDYCSPGVGPGLCVRSECHNCDLNCRANYLLRPSTSFSVTDYKNCFAKCRFCPSWETYCQPVMSSGYLTSLPSAVGGDIVAVQEDKSLTTTHAPIFGSDIDGYGPGINDGLTIPQSIWGLHLGYACNRDCPRVQGSILYKNMMFPENIDNNNVTLFSSPLRKGLLDALNAQQVTVNTSYEGQALSESQILVVSIWLPDLPFPEDGIMRQKGEQGEQDSQDSSDSDSESHDHNSDHKHKTNTKDSKTQQDSDSRSYYFSKNNFKSSNLMKMEIMSPPPNGFLDMPYGFMKPDDTYFGLRGQEWESDSQEYDLEHSSAGSGSGSNTGFWIEVDDIDFKKDSSSSSSSKRSLNRANGLKQSSTTIKYKDGEVYDVSQSQQQSPQQYDYPTRVKLIEKFNNQWNVNSDQYIPDMLQNQQPVKHEDFPEKAKPNGPIVLITSSESEAVSDSKDANQDNIDADKSAKLTVQSNTLVDELMKKGQVKTIGKPGSAIGKIPMKRQLIGDKQQVDGSQSGVQQPQDSPRPIVNPTDSPRPIVNPTDSPRPIVNPTDSPRPIVNPTDSPRPIVNPTDSPRPIVNPTDSPRPIVNPTDSPRLIVNPTDFPRPIVNPTDSPRPIVNPTDSPRPIIKPTDSPRPIINPTDSPKPIINPNSNRNLAHQDPIYFANKAVSRNFEFEYIIYSDDYNVIQNIKSTIDTLSSTDSSGSSFATALTQSTQTYMRSFTDNQNIVISEVEQGSLPVETHNLQNAISGLPIISNATNTTDDNSNQSFNDSNADDDDSDNTALIIVIVILGTVALGGAAAFFACYYVQTHGEGAEGGGSGSVIREAEPTNAVAPDSSGFESEQPSPVPIAPEMINSQSQQQSQQSQQATPSAIQLAVNNNAVNNNNSAGNFNSSDNNTNVGSSPGARTLNIDGNSDGFGAGNSPTKTAGQDVLILSKE